MKQPTASDVQSVFEAPEKSHEPAKDAADGPRVAMNIPQGANDSKKRGLPAKV